MSRQDYHRTAQGRWRAVRRGLGVLGATPALTITLVGSAPAQSHQSVSAGQIRVVNVKESWKPTRTKSYRFRRPSPVDFAGTAGVRFWVQYRLTTDKTAEAITRIEREADSLGSGTFELIWEDTSGPVEGRERNGVYVEETGVLETDVIEQDRAVVRYRIQLTGEHRGGLLSGGTDRRTCRDTAAAGALGCMAGSASAYQLPVTYVVRQPQRGGRPLAAAIGSAHVSWQQYRNYAALYDSLRYADVSFDPVLRQLQRDALTLLEMLAQDELKYVGGIEATELWLEVIDRVADRIPVVGPVVSGVFLLHDLLELRAATEQLTENINTGVNAGITNSCFLEAMTAGSVFNDLVGSNTVLGMSTRAGAMVARGIRAHAYGSAPELGVLTDSLTRASGLLEHALHLVDTVQSTFEDLVGPSWRPTNRRIFGCSDYNREAGDVATDSVAARAAHFFQGLRQTIAIQLLDIEMTRHALGPETAAAGPRLTVAARNDRPGPVKVYMEVFDRGFGKLFEGILIWDANDNTFAPKTFPVPATTAILRLTFLEDQQLGSRDDQDRDAFIDYLEWGGVRYEAGTGFMSGSTCRGEGLQDGGTQRYVARCPNTGDWVMYNMAGSLTEEPVAEETPPPAAATDPKCPPIPEGLTGWERRAWQPTCELAVTTLNDKPGPVRVRWEGFDAAGARTFGPLTLSWDADDNTYSAIARQIPKTTRRLRLTFTSDFYRPGGPDSDRNAFIDAIDWAGLHHLEAENFARTGGSGADPGCGRRLHADTFGRRVADCGSAGDWVEYDLPAVPE